MYRNTIERAEKTEIGVKRRIKRSWQAQHPHHVKGEPAVTSGANIAKEAKQKKGKSRFTENYD